VVLSVDEMQRLISAATNLKHKAIICLMYSTSIRISEVINLKIEDIDSSRMIIFIKDAKGGKDRQVPLDLGILNLLRQYYKEFRPKEYLFNGQFDVQYSERSISQFLKKYAEAAGIKKKIYPHLIRHTSATHLLEQGTDMSIIQKILGHSDIKTTHLYSQISSNLISNIKTPIAAISI
jgi:site-specific recombinase XerD